MQDFCTGIDETLFKSNSSLKVQSRVSFCTDEARVMPEMTGSLVIAC